MLPTVSNQLWGWLVRDAVVSDASPEARPALPDEGRDWFGTVTDLTSAFDLLTALGCARTFDTG
ncbi:hypothetical protein ACFPNZ_13155 [Microvirga aerilata]